MKTREETDNNYFLWAGGGKGQGVWCLYIHWDCLKIPQTPYWLGLRAVYLPSRHHG